MLNPLKIQEFMKNHNLTNYADLESIWVKRVIDIAETAKFDYLVWEEVFTNGVKVRSKS